MKILEKHFRIKYIDNDYKNYVYLIGSLHESLCREKKHKKACLSLTLFDTIIIFIF